MCEQPYCPECRLFLKPHETDTDREFVPSEFWGMNMTVEMRYEICGACGSDTEQRHPCVRCKSALPTEGYDECAACVLVIEEEEKAMVAILKPLEAA